MPEPQRTGPRDWLRRVIPTAVTEERLPELCGAIRDAAITLVRRYNRQTIEVAAPIPDEPCLIVGNHGFGGIFDLNVFAMLSMLDRAGLERDVTFLVHQLAWTVGVGPLIEPLGARQANQDNADEAFAAGHHVVVFPGGDIEAGKSFRNRNKVIFSSRSGFARLAMESGVPIVPVVTAGAGESLIVLTSGQPAAAALGLDRMLRLKALPISVSVPFGLSVGLTGMLPYVPLPSKLTTEVLPAMRPQPGESGAALASRVEEAMQRSMARMALGRKPLIG